MAQISEGGRDLKSMSYFFCSVPPLNQNGLCVEVSLLSQVTEAWGSPKMALIPLDPTWMTSQKHSRLG